MLTMSSSHANANKAVYDACRDDIIAGAGDSALAPAPAPVVEPAPTGAATGPAAATFAFDDMGDPNYNLMRPISSAASPAAEPGSASAAEPSPASGTPPAPAPVSAAEPASARKPDEPV